MPENDEKWLSVTGYEGLYEVSNLGRVKSLHRTSATILSPFKGGKGYEIVSLCKNGFHHRMLVHRMVAAAFLANPDGKTEVNHLDGDKHNNKASNLQWVSHSENQIHARETGLNPLIKNNPITSRPVDMFSLDGCFLKTFPSGKEAERQTGIKRNNISNCCNGRCGVKTAGGYIWRFHDK